MPITSLLIANRGEIACRIMKTASAMGIRTIAVHSDPDARALHVRTADEAVALVGTTSAESYLDIDKVIAAARRTGADAIHPGYGFLSENAEFAARVEEAGLVFVGPTSASIADMGLKDRAKQLASAAGVPILPGAQIEGNDESEWRAAARGVGFPLIVKAVAGGGGKGMRLVRDELGLVDAVRGARREAASSFGNEVVFIERYLDAARHVEIQVVADTHGQALHLFDRECSIQRRHQKILEEAPSSAVDDTVREAMGRAAVDLVKSIGYRGVGTVEYLFDDSGPEPRFYFLEMNTRLQVEHPVTELVTGLDLVRLQLQIAAGEPLGLSQADVRLDGHAIEVRLCAENPSNGYLPSAGKLHRYEHAELPGVRYEDGVASGDAISPFYDPMIAKILAHGRDRTEAAARLRRAVVEIDIHGPVTNRDHLAAVLAEPDFLAGATTTDYLDQHPDLARQQPDADVLDHLAALVAWDVRGAARLGSVAARVEPAWRTLGTRSLHPIDWRLTDRDDELPVGVRVHGDHSMLELVFDRGDDKVVRVVETSLDGAIVVRTAGTSRRVTVDRHGELAWVRDARGSTAWEQVNMLPEAGQSAASTGMRAELPGTVVSIDVAEGDSVVAGQRLVVIEAMKMEHPILAPTYGVVEKLLVKLGTFVDQDAELVTMQEPR
ncbi:ATP-binding protein [Rhodococcus koreensis]